MGSSKREVALLFCAAYRLGFRISFLTQLTVLRRAGVFETLEGDHENPGPRDWNGLAVLGRLPPSLAQFSGETEAAPNLIPLSLYNAIVEGAVRNR
jgi:hypothetical protein